MLVLFDIDGTLITSKRAGLHAMSEAVAEVCGRAPDVSSVSIAGRLDPLILAEIITAAGVEPTHENMTASRALYREKLDVRLSEPGIGRVLPGVQELLDRLLALDSCDLGLVTGNFQETGRLKLDHCGIDHSVMHFNGFGDDCPVSPPHRRQLPAVAVGRHAETRGAPLPDERVIVIGDTPADVDCAHHNGYRALAVATGMYSREVLQETGADLTVDDLSRTDDLIGWMREEASQSPR